VDADVDANVSVDVDDVKAGAEGGRDCSLFFPPLSSARQNREENEYWIFARSAGMKCKVRR